MTMTTLPLKAAGRDDLLAPRLTYMVFLACGMAPIAALCFSIWGICSLRLGTSLLVVPGLGLSAALGFRFPKIGKEALKAWEIGIAAVFVYDLLRWTGIYLGTWDDFIPKIGGQLLETSQLQTPEILAGYLWRWLGNGGGMGCACIMLYRLTLQHHAQTHPLKFGVCFGVLIWICLLLTLLSPDAQELLFEVTPKTLLLSLAGHLVYGGVLGLYLRYSFPKS